MKKYFASLMLYFVLIISHHATAQTCPFPYAPQDRANVKLILANQVTPVLDRLTNLAFLSSIGEPVVSLGLSTQRQALELEFRALISYLDTIPVSPEVKRLNRRSQLFLRAVINSQKLQLSEATIIGTTQQEAETNAGAATRAASAALTRIWDCY